MLQRFRFDLFPPFDSGSPCSFICRPGAQWLGSLLLLIAAVSAYAQLDPAAPASIAPTQLRTASLLAPRGLDSPTPHFSWQLAAVSPSARGLRQTAYRVLVSSSLAALQTGQGDTWDSGRVESAAQLDIACACRPLQPHSLYYWKVMTWDADRRASAWSEPALWQTGMGSGAAWQAHWIAAGPDQATPPVTREGVDLPAAPAQPLPLFRREFVLDKPIATATVAVSGLGQYELHVNGRNVTASVMNPGWTDYRKRVFYNMYDLTQLLKPGANALGVLLGNGMYDVPNVPGRYNKFTGSFGQPKLVLQLMIRYVDGSETTIVTDNAWASTPGPITLSSIYGGEDYDARREQPGWDLPRFRAEGWNAAAEVAGPGGALVAQLMPPVVVAQTYKPVRSDHFDNGITVYDLGSNFSGWPKITVQGAAGSRIKILAGELLDAAGRVTQKSNNAHPGFDNEFNYTLRGGAVESWHPQFSYNGFRYVELQATAAPGEPLPQILDISGSFLHDDAPITGQFESSDELFVRIHKLIDQAILSNMVSVLTDCPTREKLGWLEQTHLAATSIMYNYDVLPLYRKMADDMADAQLGDGLVPAIAPEFVAFIDKHGQSTLFRDSPEWGSAIILSPMAAYRFYGDTAILADHYAAMQKYAGYLASKTKDGMLAYGLGDWYDIGPNNPGFSQLTGKSLTATAIYYQDLVSLAQIAQVLGRPQDAQRYTNQAAEVKVAFNRALFHPATGQYDRGSQTANAMPLALGLVPEDRRNDVLENLVKDIRNHGNHITAGDIGFHYVVRALTDNGRSDVLAALLSETGPPSYGYQLKRGATSLTEAWNANPENSQNHFMLGHAEEWFYRGLAGVRIDLANEGPERIRIQPAVLDSVNRASASEDTVFGGVRSSWKKTPGSVAFDITIPAGQQATVTLPVAAGSKLTEGDGPLTVGNGLLTLRRDAASVTLVVGSGSYHFVRLDHS
jgi:hypothetical protein